MTPLVHVGYVDEYERLITMEIPPHAAGKAKADGWMVPEDYEAQLAFNTPR
jgi:hypothetical protein